MFIINILSLTGDCFGQEQERPRNGMLIGDCFGQRTRAPSQRHIMLLKVLLLSLEYPQMSQALHQRELHQYLFLLIFQHLVL